MSFQGKMTIAEAKETISLFLNVPQQGVPFVRSTPGVGKSAIVYQLALDKAEQYALGAAKCPGCAAKDEFDRPTGDPTKHIRGCSGYHSPDGCALCTKGVTRVTYVGDVPTLDHIPAPLHIRVDDIRLSLFDPIEVKGLPLAEVESNTTRWFRPEFLNCDDEVYSILFLDEFANAAPAVQNASLQLVYDRRSHKHKLSKRCLIVLAGNTEGDGTHISKMSSALNNRVAHLEVVADADAFLVWARENAIRPEIVGAISTYPDTLLPTKFDRTAQAQPTPRTWEMLSRVVDQLNTTDEKIIRRLAVPLIGNGATTEFMAFLGQYQRVKPEEIVNEGKMPTYDDGDVSQKYAYSCAVAHWVKTHADEVKQKHQAENVFKFLKTFKQVELRVKTLQDMNLGAAPRLVTFFRNNAKADFLELMDRLTKAVSNDEGKKK